MKAADLHKQWMQDENYVAEYDALAPEFALASTFIAARKRAGLTQAELALKMHVKQPFIARLESGRAKPSFSTLNAFAIATNSKVSLDFSPLN